MDSKRSLGLVGVLSIVALIAAVWLVARPAKMSLGDVDSSAETAVAPAASHDEKIALQFYRNTKPLGDTVFQSINELTRLIDG